mmetsp:Transcript_119547/g.343431  ORF Transcript_119547/g.343431 Transcript_119547/m.343431 type:complete len:221 (-) Transcript_119547:207-869(-)
MKDTISNGIVMQSNNRTRMQSNTQDKCILEAGSIATHLELFVVAVRWSQDDAGPVDEFRAMTSKLRKFRFPTSVSRGFSAGLFQCSTGSKCCAAMAASKSRSQFTIDLSGLPVVSLTMLTFGEKSPSTSDATPYIAKSVRDWLPDGESGCMMGARMALVGRDGVETTCAPTPSPRRTIMLAGSGSGRLLPGVISHQSRSSTKRPFVVTLLGPSPPLCRKP